VRSVSWFFGGWSCEQSMSLTGCHCLVVQDGKTRHGHASMHEVRRTPTHQPISIRNTHGGKHCRSNLHPIHTGIIPLVLLFQRRRRAATAQVRRMPTSPTSAIPVLTSLSASTVTSRQSLNDTIPREHSTINREVLAHHKGTHGCVLLSQPVGFVCKICLVFSTVDEH
jgi:hypothetical protein